MNRIDIKPSEDGITHINAYSKSQTELGRLLSNFALTPFVHPKYGSFKSLEGFWYWAATGKVNDNLKNVYGYSAKTLGKTYSRVQNDNFEKDIIEATKCKIEQNSNLKCLLEKNTLPIVHYYNYGNLTKYKIVFSDSNKFQIEYFENYGK